VSDGNLERFRFSRITETLYLFCFHAIPGKSVSRFAWQNRDALLQELL
jgi:hypothetical protein